MADRSGEHFGTYCQVRRLGQDEVPFLVMDYAQDGSLRKLHPKGIPLPLAQVVTSVKQVADALQYAHEQKFIYHDVKPEDFTIQVKKREFSLAEKQASKSEQVLFHPECSPVCRRKHRFHFRKERLT